MQTDTEHIQDCTVTDSHAFSKKTMYNDYWVVGGAKGGAKAGDFMPQRSKLFYVSDTKYTDFQQKISI